MEAQSKPFLSFADLMATVGSFIFYWSLLEQELTEGIRQTRDRIGRPPSNIRGSVNERLDIWLELISQLPENQNKDVLASDVRDQTLALKDVRNLIVHGLQAGSSMPTKGTAFIRCAVGGYDNPSGEIVSYTIEQLKDFTQAIDACRRAFIRLDSFNYRIGLPVHIGRA